MIFKNKTILVTGGTGSLGQRLIERILTNEMGQPKKIIVFSRDESKQHDMRVKWLNTSKKSDSIIFNNFKRLLEFRIGDIRNYDDILSSLKGTDIVVNAAALKHVPVCEYFPEQALLTNCFGSINLIKCIHDHDLKIHTVVGISTDKASSPINVMGMTKAIQERILIASNIFLKKTKILNVRYGNVIASRGSVIPLFAHQIENNKNLTLTDKRMTRFLLNLDQAVDTIFFAIKYGKSGDTIVPKAPSCKVEDLAKVLSKNKKYNGKIKVIGSRPGEKIHEVMVTEEEAQICYKLKNYFKIAPMLPELSSNEKLMKIKDKYSSEKPLLNLKQVEKLLITNKIIDKNYNILLNKLPS